MTDYKDMGFDSKLRRIKEKKDLPRYNRDQSNYIIDSLDGEKIVDPQGKFWFIPMSVPVNPKEGETYFDKNDRVLRIWTGSEWQTL